jgi:hypothetical protein
MWQVVSGTVRNHRPLLSDIYSHLTSTVWIVLTQNLLMLAMSLTVSLTVKIQAHSHVVCRAATDKITAAQLACESLYFLRTWTGGCTLEETHYTNMATGYSRFSVVEELSSPAFCTFAASVSPKTGVSGITRLKWQSLPYICEKYLLL